MNETEIFIKYFDQINNKDIPSVGGKNASLGEMYNTLSNYGIKIPYGFAITVNGFWEFIYSNKLKAPINTLLNGLDKSTYGNLKEVGEKIRTLIHQASIPKKLSDESVLAYQLLCKKEEAVIEVAVRSSATAEDLPNASFAGQHESFLNIQGEAELLKAVQSCYASLYLDRAIKYREDNHFEHDQVALSVGVQKMIRSDLASSGIIFTIEPESGFKDIIHISGCWGLGENIVQGSVDPDEFYVFKPTFRIGKKAIVSRKLGSKLKTMIYAEQIDHLPVNKIVNIDTPTEKANQFVLNESEILQLAAWALSLEKHYQKPMDIEWAKDGITNEIFIVQARPETVHTNISKNSFEEYTLKEKGKLIVSGSAVGRKISSGIAKIIKHPSESDKLKEGEILVTELTNPDWDPILKKAGGIITSKGGRTSHASIVARELGVVAIVGATEALEKIKDGDVLTLSCAEGQTGFVYEGKLSWRKRMIDIHRVELPKTAAMLIASDPESAFQLSMYPNSGIGLLRLEFIINNSIKVHPMALAKFDSLKEKNTQQAIEKITKNYDNKKAFFIEKLSEAVATIACAFYPKEVIVRMSDFKTNEYAHLFGGADFEPEEENPMLGFRGASRYYHEKYKEGFELECAAMKRVRNEMGLTNVKLMIPFCRTVEEGKKVIQQMADFGLSRKENGLEIYMMVEIPSNVILADEFAKLFDGFSIGSNDLTQLTLGIDRDSEIVSPLFDEQNKAVEHLITEAIASAKKNKIKIGLCGQAPSDKPEFANFLINQKIDSISFNPDALLQGIENMVKAEKEFAETHQPIGFNKKKIKI